MLSLSGSFPGAHFVAFALSVGVVAVSAMLVAGIKKIARLAILASTGGVVAFSAILVPRISKIAPIGILARRLLCLCLVFVVLV